MPYGTDSIRARIGVPSGTGIRGSVGDPASGAVCGARRYRQSGSAPGSAQITRTPGRHHRRYLAWKAPMISRLMPGLLQASRGWARNSEAVSSGG
jgi:hypothetical protein